MTLPPLPSLPPLAPLANLAQTGGAAAGATANFGSLLANAIGGVNQIQQNAQSSIDKFLSGEDEEVHKVALATQEAALSFDLFLQVRNKVVSAYQEVMRMQM
ncbi:MAG TPA: flagellar hook-basal body complex protein FliE [Bryobacteraceae bacterium]|nr:flagellar hook-basal body complex protein FliE [Bryobacteraceae bacterium]